MSCRWPKNVIVVNPKPAPPAPPFEILPIRRPVPTDGPHERLSDRVFTCLYRAGRGGIVREPEGIETPLPGKSSERTWSKG